MGSLIKLVVSALLATGGVNHLQATHHPPGGRGRLCHARRGDDAGRARLPRRGALDLRLALPGAGRRAPRRGRGLPDRDPDPGGGRLPRPASGPAQGGREPPPQQHRWRPRSHASSGSTKARCCSPRRSRAWPPPAAAASDDSAATRQCPKWQLRRSAPRLLRRRLPRPSPPLSRRKRKSGWRRCPCRGICRRCC